MFRESPEKSPKTRENDQILMQVGLYQTVTVSSGHEQYNLLAPGNEFHQSLYHTDSRSPDDFITRTEHCLYTLACGNTSSQLKEMLVAV
ncbi:hypothetical protein MD588_13195 [Photobacterium sp. SDRW27]|uniref:hypothetical protein n=1 Tax=Photobacterium obscurum TaxID=2829490 RepID=UPI00224420A7|nr:hypothetical protein [Photobacterium obscurum]MCW8329767.1 hypothetical protein [Photobacterium obscurum]